MSPKRLSVASCVFWVFLTCVSFVLADDSNIQIVPYLATEEREFFGTPNLYPVYFVPPAISLNYKSGKVVISGNPDGTGDIDVGEELRVTSSPGSTIFTYQNCPQKRMPPLDITHLMWMGTYENNTNITLAFIARNCFDTAKQNGQTVAYSNISKIYLVHFKNPDSGLPFPFLYLPWSLNGKNLSFVEAIMNERSGFSTFPKLKYSWDSSSGLTHDTSVLASAGGTATFDNSCLLCGNSIYIDHGNKFQTRYHHLQTSGLFVNSLAPKKTVIQGQEIGRVQAGSTGAVLDFEVVKDVNGDGNFNDNLIDGLVDPTGWNSISSIPWKTYDGEPRNSLWLPAPSRPKKTVGVNGGNFSFARGSINIQKNLFTKDHLISLEPIYPTKFDSLGSIGSGVSVKLDYGFGNLIKKFNQKFQIVFTLFGINAARFNQSNFGIYSREEGAEWTKEVTTIDLNKKQATINIDHLTDFALMGEAFDQISPFTKARVINSKLSFEVSDLPIGNSLGIEKTMFRLDEIPVGTRLGTDGGAWVLYSSPVSLVQNKKYILEFFSVDKDGNTENVKGISIFGDYDPDKIPVLFIPGFGGSELVTGDEISWSMPDGHGGTYSHFYPKGEVIWVNSLQAILPGNDDYFDVMRLKEDGVTGEANLTLSGRMFDAYQGAISFFESNGYTLDQDLFYFPYDWRKDVTLTTNLLDQKIESIKAKTGVAQVNIVAHSMGGLVARNYILDGSRASKVKKLITLGTPHLGAVEMLKNLMYGGCLTDPRIINPIFCLGLESQETKDLLQNMSSGYSVIPSQKYYDLYNGADNNHPWPFVDNRDIDNNGVTGLLDYFKLKNLLSNMKHNATLFSFGEAFHQSDSFLSNPNGVDVTIIAGSGIATLGQIIEDYSFDFAGIKIPKTDMRYINGDNTAPLYSVTLKDGQRSMAGPSKIYYSKQKHGELFGAGPAMNLVKNILTSDGSLPTGVSNTPFKFSGQGLSVHSPVNIHVYDANGNHTGLNSSGELELGIPDSTYDNINDAKFVFLPADGVYQIKFESTGEGSFDFKIRDFKDDLNSQTTLYKAVPLTSRTLAKATFDTTASQGPILSVDTDGNGTTDKEYGATSILKGEVGYASATAPSVAPTSTPIPTSKPNSTSTPSPIPSSTPTPVQISTTSPSPTSSLTLPKLAVLPESSPSDTGDVMGVQQTIQNEKVTSPKKPNKNHFAILVTVTILIIGGAMFIYWKFFG